MDKGKYEVVAKRPKPECRKNNNLDSESRNEISDGFYEDNSKDTRSNGESDEGCLNYEYVFPDQERIAINICGSLEQKSYTECILQEVIDEQELSKPVNGKMASIAESMLFKSMKEGKLK